MTQTSHDTFAAFIGIDWADAKHDLCLQSAGTAKRECFQLEPTFKGSDLTSRFYALRALHTTRSQDPGHHR